MDCILRAVANWALAGGCIMAAFGHLRAATAQQPSAAAARSSASDRQLWDDGGRSQRSELRLVSHEEQQARRQASAVRAAVFDEPSEPAGEQSAYEWHPTPQPVKSTPAPVAQQALATEELQAAGAVRRAVASSPMPRSRGQAVHASTAARRASASPPMSFTAPPRLRHVADEGQISPLPRGPQFSTAGDLVAPWQRLPGGRRTTPARSVQYELPQQRGEPMLQPQPEYFEGETIEPGMTYEGEVVDEYGPDGFPMEYGGASCGHDYHGWHRCTGACCPYAWLDESSLLAGVQGFKNPTDLGRNGNFGFQEGINFSGAFWNRFGIGYQVGARWAQSNLSGSQTSGSLDHTRDQVFVTAGLYQRAYQNDGFQWGAVFDWLEDQYFVDNNFNQVRAEVSYLFRGYELGFWGAFGTSANKPVLIDGNTEYFRTTDLYAFFLRRTLSSGGQGRLWGGFTGNKDGLVGADFRVPCSNNFDLVGAANYVIPMQGPNSGGSSQEGWNLMMNLVWYPTRPRFGTHNGPYRNLFNIADNGTFVLDRTN